MIKITELLKTNKRRNKDKAIKLLDKVTENSNNVKNKEIQSLLGELINNLTFVSNSSDELLYKKVELAINSALSSEPEIELIKKINEEVTHIRKAPYDKWTPSTKVLMGLVMGLYIMAIIVFLIYQIKFPETILGINVKHLFLVASCGIAGSIISIMTRVGEFSSQTYSDKMVFLFLGMFKPIIGMSFALFIFSIIKADIIPINLGSETKEIFMIISISFLSGFSERFAMDFTGNAEKVLTGKETNKTLEEKQVT